MGLSLQAYKKIFVEDSKLLSDADFDKIVENSRQTHQQLDQLLSDRAYISQAQYLELLGSHFGTPTIDLRFGAVDQDSLKLLNENFATSKNIVAFAHDEHNLKVAMVDPTDQAVLDELKSLTPLQIVPHVAREQAIQRALILYDGTIDEVVRKLLKNGINESSAQHDTSSQGMLTAIVEAALLYEASDVHIEPFETELLIRFRIDGALRTIAILPIELQNSLVATLKIAAKIKIDQKRLPQDGRFSVVLKGQPVSVRMSTVPSLWGEKVVLRVLPRDTHQVDINSLGLSEQDLATLRSYIKRPFGLILVCGPTGSGKTSSLYAALQEIGRDKVDVVNISTIEDPIEYTIPRVTQIQTQPDIDLTFATGLRALLRQDPDIIMVGEIRDLETAEFAVRASLVGRLVLSSIHTNDAVGAIPRLIDMGIEPYLISSTLCLVVAQRLTRKLCISCRESYKLGADVIEELRTEHNLDEVLKSMEKRGVVSNASDISQLRFYKSVGCAKCGNSGYKGRTGVFELLEITDELRAGINSHEDASVLKKIALKGGMKTMFEDGMIKVMLGVIDLNELLRVVSK